MMTLLLLAPSLAAYAGFACFALMNPEHWAQAGYEARGHATARVWLRPTGGLLLVLAWLACVWRDGPSFGSLLWCLLASAAALAVALTLTWRPSTLRPQFYQRRQTCRITTAACGIPTPSRRSR